MTAITGHDRSKVCVPPRSALVVGGVASDDASSILSLSARLGDSTKEADPEPTGTAAVTYRLKAIPVSWLAVVVVSAPIRVKMPVVTPFEASSSRGQGVSAQAHSRRVSRGQRLRSRVDHLEGDLRVLRPVRQQAPLRHNSFALVVAVADDQRPPLRGDVEAVPVLPGTATSNRSPMASRRLLDVNRPHTRSAVSRSGRTVRPIRGLSE
jgi:hypothetical protein